MMGQNIPWVEEEEGAGGVTCLQDLGRGYTITTGMKTMAVEVDFRKIMEEDTGQ